MKKSLVLLLSLISTLCASQINEIELIPDGIVFPRMNTAERNALSPIEGQCIYNIQTKALECYDGSQWSSGEISTQIADNDGDTSIEVEQNADEDIIRFNTQGMEVMRHDGQTLHFPNNGQSVFIGENAGAADDLTDNRNTFVGSLSGQANTGGTQNVAVGHQALKDNATGSSNVAIGQQALQKNKNSNNIAIGFSAARDNSTGNKNIAIGGYSGFLNQSGTQNTMIGYEAGRNTATTMSGSVMLGHQAGMNATSDNRLYIDNTNTNSPLVYGEFDTNKLKVNGQLEATDRIKVGDDNSTPEVGSIRYNSGTDDFEGWNGSQWLSLTKKTAEYGPDVIDIDGNDYRTVKIGKQLWMAENLKVTKYNDGTNIQNITSNATWSNLNTGAWCHYDNNSGYDNIYGKLYNWYAVDTDKLCPTGWHVPSSSEFDRFQSSLGPRDIAGVKLKEAGTRYWDSPNHGANNSSGFTARPGGLRSATDGSFSFVDSRAYFWNADVSSSSAIGFALTENNTHSLDIIAPYETGLSIRCLKD